MKRIATVIAMIFCVVICISMVAFGSVQTGIFSESAMGDYGTCENHIYPNSGKYDIAKKATCSEKGLMYRTCIVCDYIDKADIPKDPENHSAQLATYWSYDPAPTCVSGGVKFRICYGCGGAAVTVQLPADPSAHKAKGDYVVLSEADCCSAGEKAYECKYCNEYFGNTEIPVDSEKHVVTSDSLWIIKKDPTCSEDGEMAALCDLCNNEAEKRIIPATGKHTLSDEWTVDIAPTCSAEGVKSHHCSVCDKHFDETSIPSEPDNHVFADDFATDTEATCCLPGEKSRHCKYCDAKTDVTEIPVDAKAHKYSDEWIIIKDATCQNTGLMNRVCLLCNEESIPVIIAKTTHTYPKDYVVIKESADGLSAQVRYNCIDCNHEYITIITYGENTDDVYKLQPVKNTVIEVDYTTFTVSNVAKNMTAESFFSKFINGYDFVIYDKDNRLVNDDEMIATGHRVNHKSAEGFVTDYFVSVTGDIDSDGDITASDARLILRCAASLENLSGVYNVAADVNLDGEVTASDARKTLRVAAGLDNFSETIED